MATTSRKRKKSVSNPSPPKRLKESSEDRSDFRVVNASLVLSVPPVFAANPRAGVQEMLDSMVMRYNPSLQGVVLSHSNITFAENIARIQYDCPFLVCKVAFDATVWSPRIGFNLCGRVNLCSPDHISLLIHRTFNASIPRHHIPTEIWEFEYGPAENGLEFGSAVQQNQDVDEDGEQHPTDHSSGGRWIHKLTGEVLGGKKGLLQFTIIGLTIANEMLSLIGSLQPDPFSPRHVPHRKPESENEGDSESESGLGLEEPSDDDEEEENEEDTLKQLGRRRDAEIQIAKKGKRDR